MVLIGLIASMLGFYFMDEFESPRYTKGFLSYGSWFLAQFEKKDAGDSFVLEYDIDAITGATITSSAITRSIKAGLDLVTEEVLYQQADKDGAVSHPFLQYLLWQIDLIFLWITLALAFFSSGRRFNILAVAYIDAGFFGLYIEILLQIFLSVGRFFRGAECGLFFPEIEAVKC